MNEPQPRPKEETGAASSSRLARYASSLLRLPLQNRHVALILLISHTWCFFAFGATFWIDAITFVNLGESMRSAESLKAFYDGYGSWFSGYQQPGLPVFWLMISALPLNMQWPFMAVTQHGAAAVAAYICFTTMNNRWPGGAHLFFFLALCFFPFYQSLHNAYLSESLTSTLLLLEFSFFMRAIWGAGRPNAELASMAACVALITQLRAQCGLMGLAMIFLVLIKRKMIFSISTVVIGIIIAISGFAYPAYRNVAGGPFMPSQGMYALIYSLYSNPSPSPELREEFSRLPYLPPGKKLNTMFNEGLSTFAAEELAQSWRNEGLSDAQIARRSGMLGAMIKNDGSSVILNRIFMGLTSTGLMAPNCLRSPDTIVFPKTGSREWCKLVYGHYRYLSWIDSGTHQAEFDQFFSHPFFKFPSLYDTYGKQEMARIKSGEMVKPYLSAVAPAWRNPIGMGYIPPDIWIIGAILGFYFLYIEERWIFMAVLAMMSINFAVSFMFPVGNPRFSYPLYPIYFATASLAASIYLSNRFFVNRK